MLGYFQLCLLQQNWVFLTTHWDISSCICGGKTEYSLTRCWDISSHVCGGKTEYILTRCQDNFQLCLLQQIQVFLTTCWDISSRVYGNKTRYFEPEHDLFLSLTKCFFCFNQTTLTTVLSKHKIGN